MYEDVIIISQVCRFNRLTNDFNLITEDYVSMIVPAEASEFLLEIMTLWLIVRNAKNFAMLFNPSYYSSRILLFNNSKVLKLLWLWRCFLLQISGFLWWLVFTNLNVCKPNKYFLSSSAVYFVIFLLKI